LNSKLHAVTDDTGRPIVLLLTEGQMSDHKGAEILTRSLPETTALIADAGYDSDRFRQTLRAKGIEPYIKPRRTRRVPIPFDKAVYRFRHHIENMFGRLKDWRRVATRYDRCAHTFFSAICIAATVIFWL
jgi:transposase